MSVHHHVYCQFRSLKIPLPLMKSHGKFINTIPLRNKNSHSSPASIYIYICTGNIKWWRNAKRGREREIVWEWLHNFQAICRPIFFFYFFFLKLLRHSPRCRKQLYGSCLVVHEGHYTYLSKLIGQDKWLWGAMCHFLQTTGVENSLGDNRFQK